jgi:hypothetical protein
MFFFLEFESRTVLYVGPIGSKTGWQKQCCFLVHQSHCFCIIHFEFRAAVKVNLTNRLIVFVVFNRKMSFAEGTLKVIAGSSCQISELPSPIVSTIEESCSQMKESFEAATAGSSSCLATMDEITDPLFNDIAYMKEFGILIFDLFPALYESNNTSGIFCISTFIYYFLI